MTTTLVVYKARQHLVYHYSTVQCSCSIKMKFMIIQHFSSSLPACPACHRTDRSVTKRKKSILELSYLIPVKTFLLDTLLPLQATTSYSHLVPTELRFIAIWKMNDVVVRNGLDLLLLRCQILYHVLAT